MTNEIVGSWTLEEFANGTEAAGFVKWPGRISGRLIYTSINEFLSKPTRPQGGKHRRRTPGALRTIDDRERCRVTWELINNGFVSVAINRFPPSGDAAIGEKQSFYSGRYRIINESTIEHEVMQSSVSSRIGEIYVRYFALTNDTLTLRGLGLTGNVRLIWTRDR